MPKLLKRLTLLMQPRPALHSHDHEFHLMLPTVTKISCLIQVNSLNLQQFYGSHHPI